MYQIAVCDDEIRTCREIEKYVNRFQEEVDIKLNVNCFYSGSALCEAMKEREFDLLFLDIEFPDTNGVEIGKYIRNICQNRKTQIVYISSKHITHWSYFKYILLIF